MKATVELLDETIRLDACKEQIGKALMLPATDGANDFKWFDTLRIQARSAVLVLKALRLRTANFIRLQSVLLIRVIVRGWSI